MSELVSVDSFDQAEREHQGKTLVRFRNPLLGEWIMAFPKPGWGEFFEHRSTVEVQRPA